ncbi:MAG: Crp/Fnr family transcriptional regulator [Woeseiaceae bacterium]
MDGIVAQLCDSADPLHAQLLKEAQIVKFDQGRFVFHAGDLCQAFLLLLEGDIRVQLTSASGREVTLYRITPGGSCILTTSCLLSQEDYPAEAIAESDLVAAAIPSALFQVALNRSQRFRSFVFNGFATRLKHVISRIEELAFTSIDARLGRVLLELREKQVEKVTHHDVAIELGTAREVVSRHLKRFADEGWVELGRGRITVVDPVALQRMIESTLGD